MATTGLLDVWLGFVSVRFGSVLSFIAGCLILRECCEEPMLPIPAKMSIIFEIPLVSNATGVNQKLRIRYYLYSFSFTTVLLTKIIKY